MQGNNICEFLSKMSNITQSILSNFKLFSDKKESDTILFPSSAYDNQSKKSVGFTIIIIFLIVAWVLYKYRAIVAPIFQSIFDKFRLYIHLTPAGEIITTQAPPNSITLDSVAKSLGIISDS